MERTFSWPWVEAQAAQTIDVWNTSIVGSVTGGPRYSIQEQLTREDAYDDGLRAVEREAKRTPQTRAERLGVQQRIVAVFPRFASIALGLQEDAVQLLTEGFMPAGTQVARWATRFDGNLRMPEIIQACRNAWTACGLQPLLGDRMEITPSILGYSLLYPYSDNYLDNYKVSAADKLHFSARFCDRLRGRRLSPRNRHEAAVWAMVQLIELQYPRLHYPQVFDCLLAIHRAQEKSIMQLKGCGSVNDSELLRISCAKGGTSVLADACLSHGDLNEDESRLSFEWGALLQLGDDLQDVHEDVRSGSATLFSRAAAAHIPLDSLVCQLLNFSERVADRMERSPNGTSELKELLRTSWRSLILMAVANAQGCFTPEFLAELEPCSSFRFDFLHARHKKMTGRRGIFKVLFDAFLEAGERDKSELPRPEDWLKYVLDVDAESVTKSITLQRSPA